MDKWVTHLGTYFDVIEEVTQIHLADARTERNAYRTMCFKRALMKLQQAREELARWPEGARLAYLSMEAQLNQLAPDRESQIQLRTAQRLKGQLGGRKKAERTRRHDHTIERYARQWESSDELQEQYPRSPVGYIHAKTQIPKRTIQSRRKARASSSRK